MSRPWTPEEDAVLAEVCRKAMRQGLRGWDAAVTASARLGRGVHGCRCRLRSLKLMSLPYFGRARKAMANGRPDDPAGVEPEVFGKPLSHFRGEGGGT